MVPAQFVRLQRLPDDVRSTFDGSSLHRVHHGAAPCPPDVKAEMIRWWGPIVTEYYGGTEGGFITMITAEEWQERPASVGRAIPTVEVLVIDDGKVVEAGQRGDLYFRNNFAEHTEPFLAAKDSLAVMSSYSIAIAGDGSPLTGNRVGSAYDKVKLDLLRNADYDGVICTDWGVTTGYTDPNSPADPRPATARSPTGASR